MDVNYVVQVEIAMFVKKATLQDLVLRKTVHVLKGTMIKQEMLNAIVNFFYQKDIECLLINKLNLECLTGCKSCSDGSSCIECLSSPLVPRILAKRC